MAESLTMIRQAAHDGAQTVRRIREFLTDLAMPGVSGWAVASACQERCPGTPVGLITGFGFGDRLEPDKIERHGIQFVVPKPFSSEELLRAVGAALRGAGPARS